MAPWGYSSARISLAALALALVAACGRSTPAAPGGSGELTVQWQAAPDDAAALPLEVEVRGIGREAGAAPFSRRVVLAPPSALEARLSLPPGLYTVQLSSAALPAVSAEETGASSQLPLALPPPTVVMVPAAGSSRARVALLGSEAGALATLR